MTNNIINDDNDNDIDYDILSKYCTYCCDETPDTIAFNGRCIIYIKADGFFAINGYTSSILNNPTYIDIFNLLDDIVETTGNDHNTFFEGVHYVQKINEHIHEINIIMGS
jgi:hypothetical protein